MKSKIIQAGFVLAITLAACSQKKKEKDSFAAPEIPVTVVALRQEAPGAAIQTSGIFSTDDETPLAFKTGGLVASIFVKEGDAVKRGQLLATLNLTEVGAQAQQAGLSLQKAERDYTRARALYRDSVATLEQLQNAKTALDVARQQQQVAGFNRNFSEIRAAANGFVLKKYVNAGQVVSPGTPVLLVNGAGAGKWLLKVGLSDKQWASLRIGDRAEISSDATGGATWPAMLTKKGEGIDPASGTFAAELSFNAKQGKLASGLFGRAKIYPASESKGWTIPYDALLDGDAGKGYVFVTNDRRKARKVHVSIGGIENNQVYVRSGLEGVKYLIVSGSAYLDQGSAIKITRP
ncbi:efflux RND transporter periplasmic adaptor subunit [Pedobacter sp. SYP-B3415]|uniref:efflux RND transporter periplasmic adaptor subunit n=1 Tax=Pedobacter sp. SYP-B3415 TaxID=2496641 RepID=UPI00101C64DE|nr:efflux RND transporter periplasmic adaptor subunit [Pedobacter sp. SYP-B3415]